MRVRLSLATAFLLAATGCADDPCRSFEGPRLLVYPAGQAPGGYSARVYTSISEAAAEAEAGSAICVAPGTYRETVQLDTPGISLIGAGPDSVTLRLPASPADPADAEQAVLQVLSTGATIRGMTITDGKIGLKIEPVANVTLEDLVLTENGVGLYAHEVSFLSMENVDLIRNTELGAQIVGVTGGSVAIQGGLISGNGDLNYSEVGGIEAAHDLTLDGVTFSDNAGFRAADLFTIGAVIATNLHVERPSVQSSTPRISIEGSLDLRGGEIHLRGSVGIALQCDSDSDDTVEIENLLVTDIATQDAQDHLRLDQCSGGIRHATLANLGASNAAALALDGGVLEIANSAIVGYAETLDSYALGAEQTGDSALVTTTSNFEGSLTEAAFLRALDVEPDLRPQTDSPLIDAGEDLGVQTDVNGHERPQGGGPDIGAYER